MAISNIQFGKDHGPLAHAMSFGWGLGFWMGVRFILEAQQLNYSWLGVIGWLIGLYILFGMYTSTVHYKYKVRGGKLSFGKAYLYVLELGMCAALVGALVKWAYLMWFDTDYLRYVYNTMMPLLEKLFPTQLESAEAALKALLTPIRFAVNSIAGELLTTALVGILIAALAVRAKNFLPDDADNDSEDDI